MKTRRIARLALLSVANVIAIGFCAEMPKATINVAVPEQSARLAEAVLDVQTEWLACSGHHDVSGCDIETQNVRQSRMSKLLYEVTKNRSKAADEALVVLTCFYIGESQEEADAIIARGRRMLPLIRKYQDSTPILPGRAYPPKMWRTDKKEHFNGLIYGIDHHLRGTWDNPNG